MRARVEVNMLLHGSHAMMQTIASQIKPEPTADAQR